VSESSWRLRRGDLVAQRCEVVRLLGGGRAYEAYEAFDLQMMATVVVKVLRPDVVEDSGALRGLRREIEMLGRLNHPIVVRGFHADTGGDQPYVALEFLPGPRLSTLLRKHGPLATEQVVALAVDLSSALHYLHACEVVHLDVKPSNIIMDAAPRLIDLSVARSIAAAAGLDHIVGTDRYMAPEQCDPPRSGVPGPASDVWGLGVTLYEAVCESRPYGDQPATEALPTRMPEAVDAALAGPIMACLSADPADRPTPGDLFIAFGAVRESLPAPKVGFFRPRAR
jgi:eukaryotic-like serine/threonine-protein kinase